MGSKGILHIEFVGFRGEYNQVEPIVSEFIARAVKEKKLLVGDIVFFNKVTEAKRLFFTTEDGTPMINTRPTSCIRVFCLYMDFPIRLRIAFRRLECIKGSKVYFLFMENGLLMPREIKIIRAGKIKNKKKR